MRAARKPSPVLGQAVPTSRSVTVLADIEPEQCPVRNIAARVDLLACAGMEVIHAGMTDAYGFEYDEGYVLIFMGQRYALIGDVVNHETRLPFLVQPDILHRLGLVSSRECQKLKDWHMHRRVQLLRNRAAFIATELERLQAV